MKSFPQPLTAAEESYYMQKYTEGDLEAKHILIERNLRLVAHIVKKYQTPEEDNEDLLSVGTIGLIKAVVTFNPDKSVRLGTYAARCIENEILMHFRARKKSSREISLYEPIGTDREGNEIKLYDIIETEEEDVPERLYLKENIQKLYEKVASNMDTYWKPFAGFEKTTLSESGRRLRLFQNLRYMDRREEDRIFLDVEQMEEESWFLLRTHGEKIGNIQGAEYEELEKDAYLLHVTEEHVEIGLEQNRGVLTYTMPDAKSD